MPGPNDENLSPEEKLLKVIQENDEGAEAAPAAAPPASPAPKAVEPEAAAPVQAAAATAAQSAGPTEEPPEPAAAEAAPPKAGPKLKVAEAPEAATAAAATAGKAAAEAPKPAKAKPAKPAKVAKAKKKAPKRAQKAGVPVSPGKSEEHKSGLRTANRCLVAAIVVLLLLAAFEIWANVNVSQRPLPSPTDPVFFGAEAEEELPSLDGILKSFEQRPIFGGLEAAASASQETVTPTPGWRQRLEKSLRLIGISGVDGVSEAILNDISANKMHFVRKGQEFSAIEKQFTVTRINSEEIVITDGVEEITLK